MQWLSQVPQESRRRPSKEKNADSRRCPASYLDTCSQYPLCWDPRGSFQLTNPPSVEHGGSQVLQQGKPETIGINSTSNSDSAALALSHSQRKLKLYSDELGKNIVQTRKKGTNTYVHEGKGCSPKQKTPGNKLYTFA